MRQKARKKVACTTPPAACVWKALLGFLAVSIGMAGCDNGSSLPSDPEPGAKNSLSGVYNMRDLGGYENPNGKRVRYNLIYRSDELNNLSDQDLRNLEMKGIRSIIDFRTVNERRSNGEDILPRSVANFIPIPISAGDLNFEGAAARNTEQNTYWVTLLYGQPKPGYRATDKNDRYLAMLNDPILPQFIPDNPNGPIEIFYPKYLPIIGDKTMGRFSPNIYYVYPEKDLVTGFLAEYKLFFQTLKNEANFPLIFHCSAGKDRTGFAAALLLSLLGVDREIIINDYLLSAENVREKYAPYVELIKQRTGGRGDIEPLVTVKREYIEAAFARIDDEWGGIENYFTNKMGSIKYGDRDVPKVDRPGLGLSSSDLDQIRALFLH
ncbi:MAG: tyrosine-protein phosphatase [Treponema sp.]|jgi:protein tyrosine/serine phosphatase|nr:tyrosine-protein phosphatase [Treponema sp.]